MAWEFREGGWGARKDPGEKGQSTDITKQKKTKQRKQQQKQQAFIRRRERGKWKAIAQYNYMCTVENYRELIIFLQLII